MRKERMERLPVNENDLIGVEAWLVEMAGKGLFLTETAGGWWYFRVGEPERLCYRLELMEEHGGKLKEETREVYEESGWGYVTTHEALYHIFSSKAGEAGEPYPDSSVRGAQLRMYEKRMRNSLWSAFALSVLILVQNREFFVDLRRQPILTLADSMMPVLVLEVLVLAGLLIRNFRNLQIVRNLREQTTGQDGRYISPDTMMQRKWRKPYGTLLLWLVVALLFVFVFRSCGRGGPIEQQLAGERVFPALQLIEEGTVEPGRFDTERQEMEDNSGSVIYYSSPLLKECYEVEQRGLVQKEDGTEYLAELEAEYYEVCIAAMTPAIVEEWKEMAPDRSFQALERDGFEAYLLAAEDEKTQILLARRGNKVLRVQYDGREDLAEKAEVFREIMEQAGRR